ncbi:nucleotidyltransferase family protein [Lentibacillus sp. Marseille-P4043]|uniref:nucleotidyltransferase family protein n=1 Tax=Lentibacillus sp. Marseille-P4043 TaxID=2040293 RepID=UPI00131A5073|nr:nucleotidyltransferase family protein [Lentibacillus sp. Marseille-P4043]
MKRQGIVGIYLAAGKSKRFGKNKLFQRVGNVPLGSLALRTALQSQLDKVVVVTTEADTLGWIPAELFPLYQKKWFQAVCKESVNGQSYSLKHGLRFAKKLQADAVVILLADQPLVSTWMINTIISRYQHGITNNCSFVAASRLGVTCPPILFSNNMFDELFHLQGDMGARYLIKNKANAGSYIEFSNPWSFFDVDTPDDYDTLCKKHL